MIAKKIFQPILTLFIGMLAIFAYHPNNYAAWQDPPTMIPGTFAVASDAVGNAMAIASSYNEVASIITAYSYKNESWEMTGQFFGSLDLVTSLNLSIDPNGNALAAWTSETGDGKTAYFNGDSWTFPLNNPLENHSICAKVALNTLGQGVMIWINDFEVMTSFFSKELLMWSTPECIGSGISDTAIKFSQNGTVVAGWFDYAPTFANFVQGEWSTYEVDSWNDFGDVGIDSNGNALVIWHSNDNDILSSFFDGSNWNMIQTIASGPGNSFPSLAMASNGTAVAVWIDSQLNGWSSSFNGSNWETPLSFSEDPLLYFVPPSISVNSHGDALVIWASNDNVLKSSRLPLGGTWEAEEVIQKNPLNSLRLLKSSLADDNMGYATWTASSSDRLLFGFANATLPLVPEADVSSNNRFQQWLDYFKNLWQNLGH